MLQGGAFCCEVHQFVGDWGLKRWTVECKSGTERVKKGYGSSLSLVGFNTKWKCFVHFSYVTYFTPKVRLPPFDTFLLPPLNSLRRRSDNRVGSAQSLHPPSPIVKVPQATALTTTSSTSTLFRMVEWTMIRVWFQHSKECNLFHLIASDICKKSTRTWPTPVEGQHEHGQSL